MSLTLSPAQIVEHSTSPLVQADPRWARVPLGSVATILNGAAFKSGLFTDGDGVPLIRIRDIRSENTTVRYSGPFDDRYLVRPGELLVGMDGDFNVARWMGPEALLNRRVCCLRPDESALDVDFLSWLLPGYLQAIHDVTSSTTVKHLSSRDIAAIPIPLPKLAEQRRIAAWLDEIDAERESVADRLAAARAIVDRLRVAVLGAAFAQLQHTAPVVSLQSILREPLKNGYSACPVGRVTTTRVLTLTATTAGYFDPQHFKYTDDEIPTDSPLWLEPGDILIQRGNTAELVGVPAVYDGAPHEFIYPDLMIRARVSHGIDPRYVWYMLLAPQSRAFLRGRAIGTAGNMPKINQKTVNSLPLPLPSKEEQDIVVSRVAAALDAAGRLSKAISAAECALGAAIRGALAKAFRGGLGSDLEPATIQADADGVMSQNGKPALRA